MSPGPARATKVPMNGSLVASAIALALAGVVVLVGFSTVLASALGGGAAENPPQKVVADLVALHSKEIDAYKERFEGRYIFYKPPPAPRPAPVHVPPPIDDTPPPPPKVAGPPERYTGPSVAFAVGESVYFVANKIGEKHTRISVGEEKNGVKVISTDLPWSVKVGHLGGVYDVDVFKGSDFDAFFTSNRSPTVLPGMIAMPELPVVLEATGDPNAAPAPETVAPEKGEGRPSRRGPGREAVKPGTPEETPKEQNPPDETEKPQTPDEDKQEGKPKPPGPPE